MSNSTTVFHKNLSEGIQLMLSEEAERVVKSIEEKIVFVFEDNEAEDVSKFRTYNIWYLYIITQDDEGIEHPRYFVREIHTIRDQEHNIISRSNMPEFQEKEVSEYTLELFKHLKEGGRVGDFDN
jgi:hypothetical protein